MGQMEKLPNNNDNGNSEYFDIRGPSKYLEIKVSTLYSLVAKREIPFYRIGRLVRFRKAEIELWMESNKKKCIDISKEARKVLEAERRPVQDINRVVKKAIDNVKGIAYTASYGKPDRYQGPQKGGQ